MNWGKDKTPSKNLWVLQNYKVQQKLFNYEIYIYTYTCLQIDQNSVKEMRFRNVKRFINMCV